MKITVCDICGADMHVSELQSSKAFANFHYSFFAWGQKMDICRECGKDFLKWRKERVKVLRKNMEVEE